MSKTNITLGSISHGTLRTEDLLERFADELEYQVQRDDALQLTPRVRDALVKLIWDAREIEDFDSERAADTVADLADRLNEYAPPYCYFGAHPGDGSDFGFWPDFDAVDELPKIADPNKLPLGEDAVFVNDHGNITLYDMNGNVIWDCV